MMKLAVIAALAGSTAAFAPAQQGRISSVVFETAVEEAVAETTAVNSVTPEVSAAPVVTPINGWVPDASLPLLGLPGASLPLGYFDPLGFGKGDDVSGIKRLREAEVRTRRAMLRLL
jgi:hypothetical protein